MILAGIDEAGLGPNIGPLATACAALRTPDTWNPATPWDTLSAACGKDFRRGETRLPVADSKVIYTRGGTEALQRTLSAFARALPDGGSKTYEAAGTEPENHPCYSTLDVRYGDAGDATLPAALAAADAATAHLETGLLFEPEMNARFAAGRNKNQILLQETGARLANLAAAFPKEKILVVIDKQGGRNDYLPFLTELFPGAWVEVLAAGAAESVYRVRALTAHFTAKGDRDSFATALASMAAKHARERAMTALNQWFGERVPGLRGTAGYPVDAKRWRADVLRAENAESLLLDRVWRIR